MRLLFAGSPAIAVPALEAVYRLAVTSKGLFELAGLLTNPDSPRGRHGTSEPTETAAALERLAGGAAGGVAGATAPAGGGGGRPAQRGWSQGGGSPPLVPILKPEKLDAAAREQAAALQPDLLVSFAYGRIFGPKFLALFPLGGINLHPSLLPKYRGPTPIPAAILNRDRETGLSIQRLALEMDSGDILAQQAVPLNGRETTASLSETMALTAAAMLPPVLAGLAAGTIRARAQNHAEATYCSLIDKADGLIDWSSSAAEIEAAIRAYNPWPQCWTFHNGRRLFILQAGVLDATLPASPSPAGLVLGKDEKRGILIQTGNGVLAAAALQYQAKKALDWQSFLNGARNFLGAQLG
jgi:methionyl-tRNA formyltransferase